MKNPILWLCVFVALAGAAAFLYLNLGSDAEELTPNESTPLQDDQTEETGAARRHLPKLFEKPLKDEAPAPGSKSTAVDLQNTRLVLLRVLDAESERPLEGIGIFVADETPEMRTRAEAFIKEHPELARDRRAMMKALCERFETGSQGEILARLSNRRLTFLVDDARYAGNARLKSAEGTDAEAAPTDSQTTATLVISVTLKKNFYAKVLDAQGQPLSGFHLKLLPSSQRSSFGGQSTPTDRTGLAKIEIAPKFGQPHSQGNAEKYSWHVMGLFRKNLAIEAEESTTSEQPQIIQLPELGWIDLSLVGPNQKALGDKVNISLRHAHKRHERPDLETMRQVIVGSTSNGMLKMGPVGLNLTVNATCSPSRESDVASRSFEFDGPTANAEVLSKTLAWAKKASVITGHIVDENGDAITNQAYQYRIVATRSNSGRSSHGSNLDTDSQGKFRLVLSESDAEPVPGQTVIFELTERNRNVGLDLRPQIRVDLTERLKTGELDLGAIRATLAPVLVAGRVVSSSGDPIEGAQFSLSRLIAVPNAPDHFPGHYNNALLGHLNNRSKEDGTFQIRGYLFDSTTKGLFAAASKTGFLKAQEVACELGQSNLVLVLAQAASFVAQVVADENVKLSTLAYSLRPADEQGYGWSGLPRGGKIQERELKPGAYNFQIVTQQGHPLTELVKLQFVAGTTTDLGKVPIKVDFKRYTFEFSNEKGDPLRKVMILSDQEQSGRVPLRTRAHNSVHNLDVMDEKLQLLFSCPGYLSQSQKVVPGKTTVIFSLAPKVTVQLIGNLPKLGKNESLSFHCQALGKRPVFQGPVVLDDSFRAEFSVAGLGPQNLTLHVLHKSEKGAFGTGVTLPRKSLTFDVTSASSQTIKLLVPDDFASLVAAAMARLRERYGVHGN